MRKFLFMLPLIASTFVLGSANASQMSYKFLIPAFGGDPNYFYVFKTEADVQNIYHAPSQPTSTSSPIDDFKNRLQYMILDRLADKIVAAAFGETEELPEGQYVIGDFGVEIQPTSNSIQVHLTNLTTGTTTVVEVPKYNF